MQAPPPPQGLTMLFHQTNVNKPIPPRDRSPQLQYNFYYTIYYFPVSLVEMVQEEGVGGGIKTDDSFIDLQST